MGFFHGRSSRCRSANDRDRLIVPRHGKCGPLLFSGSCPRSVRHTEGDRLVSLTPVQTDKAPAAIGPYSQGIIANGFLFTAGQIALDPASGHVVAGGVGPQTERVMTNLTAVLAAAGANWSHVVKTTVYLQDMNDFPTVNEV